LTDIGDIRASQGSGLGLSICKAYVEILGGKIWLDSEENKGTTFYFTLPYKLFSKTLESNDNAKNIEKKTNFMKSLKILIVEDDKASDMHLSILLEENAKEILHATNGPDAIELCHQHPDINLILMDIKLPDVNGYEVTMRIRDFNKEVVIIAETAYAMKGDREKVLEAGCNDYITKPIDEGELLKTISKYFK